MPSSSASGQPPGRSAGRRPRRRGRLLAVGFAVIAGLVVGAGALAAVRLVRTPPPPNLHLRLAATLAVAPGPAPAIPLPTTGSFDLVSSDGGQIANLAPTTVVPIGSIAKVMTALVVLKAKPLAMGQSGPNYTITDQDVAFYDQVVAGDGSNLPVTAGEQFSERQLLLALLLPSANNIAETLAVWVAGSQPAFIAELNSEAKALGMTQTSFADASGYSPQTVSTASDLVKLGQAALANPALAYLVGTPTATMPDGTTIHNLDTDLGTVPGWLGIKTGSTPQAGGCLLFAAEHTGPVGASSDVQVVGAVLGQTTPGGTLDDELGLALTEAATAVKAAFEDFPTIDPGVAQAPRAVGHAPLRVGDQHGPAGELRERPLLGRGPDRCHPGALGEPGPPSRSDRGRVRHRGRPRDRQHRRRHRRDLGGLSDRRPRSAELAVADHPLMAFLI